MDDRLDVIIFGASGFTGKYTILEGVKILSDLKWGIAGRSKDKLHAILKEVGGILNKDISNIPCFIADINDEDSLVKMAEKAKVLVNCCGPYRLFGEPVIKACILAGTHHVDVTAETEFIERMQLEYNDSANEKGVYVIPACGLLCIPADLGVIFTEKHFDGEVNSVEIYMKSWTKGKSQWQGIHYGTWHAAILHFANFDELKSLRAKLFPGNFLELKPKLEKHLIHKSKVDNEWSIISPTANKSVVENSQWIFYQKNKKRPVQVVEYASLQCHLVFSLLAILCAYIFQFLVKFSFARKLLLKYPRIFSFGIISHEGRSDILSKNARFSFTFYAKGWPKHEALTDPTDQHTNPPSKMLITRMAGNFSDYAVTAIFVLLAAKTILKDHSKMPGKGGVLPPGVAFANTDYLSELANTGLKFEVVAGNEATLKDE